MCNVRNVDSERDLRALQLVCTKHNTLECFDWSKITNTKALYFADNDDCYFSDTINEDFRR
jgi:hypothetical protein